MSFWEKLLEFVEKHLANILVAFGIGYKIGRKKNQEFETKADKLEYENELLKNKEIVRSLNDGKPPSDIIDDVIRSGSGHKDSQ